MTELEKEFELFKLINRMELDCKFCGKCSNEEEINNSTRKDCILEIYKQLKDDKLFLEIFKGTS